MKSAKSIPRRDRGWRRSSQAGSIELLNVHWRELRGGPSLRSCPICEAKVSGDHAVHHGGELYHADCARHRRERA